MGENALRIEVASTIPDTRAGTRKEWLNSQGFAVEKVEIADVYTIDADVTRETAVQMLVDPVTQTAVPTPEKFDWAVEVGFLPGVTDNVGSTVKEEIEDLNTKVNGAYTSQITFISGNLSRADAKTLAEKLANPVIQRTHIKSFDEFARDNGMGIIVPRVKLQPHPEADLVDILNAGNEQLTEIGKKGIKNQDGSFRGPLALDLAYMTAIQNYFKEKSRNPTDIELESIAQTWSEHCKHTIFADPIDEITEGLYKKFIKSATNKIRELKGKNDFCVSVFSDNAGVIMFDENYLITDKAETHNSPSALDPFGGSITGIVGVNRDAIGCGLGAKPIINRFGFCFADPGDAEPLYKDKDLKQKMLSPRAILEGVVNGVNVGGNCSGIPTNQGFVRFDSRYKGKPLVFVGTVGLLPLESAGRIAYEKSAKPGDYIVMVGGRVGQDGIHGATFSSEALDSGSPATAVQIGDPITQKKLSDAIVKEARDLGLYTSNTDNGAGGLSCSVAEMAKESGGFKVDLEKVPLKYPGLPPWKIWISESQERMTLAVPPEKWQEFKSLMERRGVEATVIGEFTNSGNCIVDYNGKNIMDMSMDFLHDGLPARVMTSKYTKPLHEDPNLPPNEKLTDDFLSMMSRLNLSSTEFISMQYDHEVQGGSVIKPLQGRGRVNGDASVTRPVLDSKKAVALSQGINPSYSDINTYNMAACAIDTAVRNLIAVGARLDRIALMDNFCWCSSTEEERLGQLKAAVQACYDYAVAYETPFISGKDSMFNDFKGFDKNANPIKLSIPPTLLISSIAVMDDAEKAVSLDAKFSGDRVYVVGDTNDELGGSEYYAMLGERAGKKIIGNAVPSVDAVKNKQTYLSLQSAISHGFVASAQSVHIGGLASALAKTSIGGMLGVHIDLSHIPGDAVRYDDKLFSESQGRFVVTVPFNLTAEFEMTMRDIPYAKVGYVNNSNNVRIQDGGKTLVNTDVFALKEAYKNRLRDY